MNPSWGVGWNTTEGEVPTIGEAAFEEVAPGRMRVDVTMNYADPPAGWVGETGADVLCNPEGTWQEDLENLARIVERGGLNGPQGPDAEPVAPLGKEDSAGPQSYYRLVLGRRTKSGGFCTCEEVTLGSRGGRFADSGCSRDHRHTDTCSRLR